MIGVADEIFEGVIYSFGVLVVEPGPHCGIGAGADEDRIVVGEQASKSHVAADLHPQPEFDAHPGEDLAPQLHHLFIQLEGGDAEG
ncbi:MAG: hypothetical protein ACD_75C00095G0001 [uncultured bacterium]|nr:MAG: hypothetical protein ACD_75C00095G0001 [uncultured bacterium]